MNADRHVPISHPNGVKPLGNSYIYGRSEFIRARREGLGGFSTLPDELLLEVLIIIGRESDRALLNLGITSKLFCVWADVEEVWRVLFSEKAKKSSDFCWLSSWKKTYLRFRYGIDYSDLKFQTPPLSTHLKLDFCFSFITCIEIQQYLYQIFLVLQRMKSLEFQPKAYRYKIFVKIMQLNPSLL